ncbi:hypothetical protein HMPREF1548_01896, partial [Clostridium sp. KLE 1755]
MLIFFHKRIRTSCSYIPFVSSISIFKPNYSAAGGGGSFCPQLVPWGAGMWGGGLFRQAGRDGGIS